MWIRRVQFNNLKCFRDTGELQFSQGINLVVGQNNVGKSTLLENLQLKFSSNPHLSAKTKPQRNSVVNPISRANVAFGTSGEELRNLHYSLGQPFAVPMPPGAADGRAVLDDIFQRQDLTIKVVFQTADNNLAQLQPQQVPAHGLFDQPYESFATAQVAATRDKIGKVKGPAQGGAGNDFSWASANNLRERVYFFKAERPVPSRYTAGTNRVLASNAANLAEVLANLQGSPVRYAGLMESVRSVIPSVNHVSVEHVSVNELEIRVWMLPTSAMREDLAVPLDRSGTGVGQVLALLYVVLTSEEPRTIVIDEPGSFLHPGAARNLIDILKGNPRHQYIISTHAPEIIGMLLDARIFLIETQGSEAVVRQIDTANLEQRTRVLREVGVRLADVYGYDAVVWVEGQTEEVCFPLIVKHFKLPDVGLAFRGVRETGSFRSRVKKEEILRIYEKLSTGAQLLPRALAFVFDRDGLRDDDAADLERSGVKLLRRRMYENYLLDARAITDVLNRTETFRATPLELPAVQECLGQYAPDPNLPDLDGAAVLDRVFGTLSNEREVYRKVEHGEVLTRWILSNSPERLQEVRELLAGLLAHG